MISLDRPESINKNPIFQPLSLTKTWKFWFKFEDVIHASEVLSGFSRIYWYQSFIRQILYIAWCLVQLIEVSTLHNTSTYVLYGMPEGCKFSLLSFSVTHVPTDQYTVRDDAAFKPVIWKEKNFTNYFLALSLSWKFF